MTRGQKQSAVERWREKEERSLSKLRIVGIALLILLVRTVHSTVRFAMNNKARHTIAGLLTLVVVGDDARAETASSQTAIRFGDTVGQYLHELSANGINANAVKNYIDSITKTDNPTSLAFDWPGEEHAVLVADLNQELQVCLAAARVR